MLTGFKSLSAVDRTSADAYMKLLLSFVMAYEFNYDSTYRRKLTRWHKESDGFIRRFRLPRRHIDAAFRGIVAGRDPEEDDKLDANIRQVLDDLKSKRDALKRELDLRKEDLTVLNDLRLILMKGSESAYRRLERAAGSFGDPDISKMFVADHEDTSVEQNEVRKLVEKHTGKPGDVMPIPVLQKWQRIAKEKGKKLKDHQRYLELRRVVNAAYKTRLQAIVRASGKPYLPLRDVIHTLDAEEIPHSLPSGFVGMIDDLGKFYTTEGMRLLQIPSGDVRMNPEYDPKKDNAYVCEFKAPGVQKPSRAYTEAYRSRAADTKYSVVSETIPQLPALAKKWRQEMRAPAKKGTLTKNAQLATLLEFVYQTSARVSSAKAQSKGERTFGATQLQVRHLTIDDHKIVATYQGKSGGKQRHILKLSTQTTKRLGKNLEALCRGKKREDYVFSVGGKTFASSSINRYMRSIGFPRKFTVHKLRTARGTLMATQALSKSPFKKGGDWSERDVNQWVEARMLDVGKELGHMSGEKYTANTAIGNYVRPEILADFYSKLGIRPPAKIQKAIDSVSKHKE